MIKFVFSYQNIVRRDSLCHVFLIKSLSQYFLYALFENINIIIFNNINIVNVL